MKTLDDVEKLEKTIGQLGAIHREISLLSKKSPNDAVNPFKLKTINTIIEVANDVLGESYKVVQGFDKFEDDDAPSTSDVVFIVAQYMEEIERFRTDHVVTHNSRKVYVLDGAPSDISANPASRRSR